jgi:hypothetical protein
MNFGGHEPSPEQLRAQITSLGAEVARDERFEDGERAGLLERTERAADLADHGDWLEAANVLLEAAELERRAAGERGRWWTLWLEVHDALIAGELGDWGSSSRAG